MAYTTLTDLELAAGGPERLRELADWDLDGSPDEAVIAQAQAQADGAIDGYARGRLQTPIVNPSPALVTLAAEEAVYWMRSRRGGISEDWRREHEDRVAWLRDMAKGLVRPTETSAVRSTALRSTYVENTGSVSRRGLKGAW